MDTSNVYNQQQAMLAVMCVLMLQKGITLLLPKPLACAAQGPCMYIGNRLCVAVAGLHGVPVCL
jgi:hypothetical protein